MKNLGLFALIAGFVIVVFMTGCSQPTRTSASANTMVAPTAKITPSPSPTIDIVAQKERDRQKSMDEQKKEWARINDPKRIFMDDVKKTGICKNREQYDEITWFFSEFPESKSEVVKLPFKLSDIGVAEADVKNQLEKAARGYLKDMMGVLKTGTDVEQCGNGEGSLDLTNKLAIAQQIEYLVTDSDLAHLKLMSPAQLRQIYLTAVKQMMSDIKNGKDVDTRMVGKTIEDFGFSLKELGTTQAELDAIKVE